MKCSPFKVDTELLREDANLVWLMFCRFTTAVIADRLMLNMVLYFSMIYIFNDYSMHLIIMAIAFTFLLIQYAIVVKGPILIGEIQNTFMIRSTDIIIIIWSLPEVSRSCYVKNQSSSCCWQSHTRVQTRVESILLLLLLYYTINSTS